MVNELLTNDRQWNVLYFRADSAYNPVFNLF